MKIRRFFAKDMRAGLSQVSTELGPEAAILSTNNVNGGVEIVAATDYEQALVEARKQKHKVTKPRISESVANLLSDDDKVTLSSQKTNSSFDPVKSSRPSKPLVNEMPQLVQAETKSSMIDSEKYNQVSFTPAQGQPKTSYDWGQDPAITGVKNELQMLRGLLQTQLADLCWTRKMETNPINVEIMRRLVSMEVPVQLAEEYASKITHSEIGEAWYRVAAMLAHDVTISELDPVEKGGCFALVGPTGVGKTTTVAKLAARAALKYGPESVAMISTDSYRIAAYEQLKIYGQILNVPVVSVSNSEEMVQTLEHFDNRRLILIDTAGVGQRDKRLAEQVNCLTTDQNQIKNILVLSSTVLMSVLNETIQRFGQLTLNGAILTKLDETTSLGPVISTLIRTKLPLSFITDGQNVPDDIHRAKAHQLIADAISLANSYPLEKDEEWKIAQGLSAFKRVS